MASVESVTLEVADPTAVNHFYTAAFGLDTQVRLRASEAPTTGFRGFTLSLTVSQPASHRQRPHRRRPRRRRLDAEAGREVARSGYLGM
jgi:catechol 2,3-dioxygenase-like lactoylglutathione lyase family enzyme